MCDQQRLRPACAYAQSDQSLCSSLEYFTTPGLLTEQHLQFLSLTGDCTGSSESTLVKMPHCWKSHAAAHIIVLFFPQPEGIRIDYNRPVLIDLRNSTVLNQTVPVLIPPFVVAGSERVVVTAIGK